MTQPGRAEVLAWQQTVDAAWQRQAGLLLGGQGAADPATIDAARNEFFGPADPDSQRQIVQTGATIPGGNDGIIVSRFFIANKDAAFGTLFGDDRTHSTDPNAGYRFSVAWDTRTGEVSLTVNSSTINNHILPDKVVPALPISVGQGGEGNNFVIDRAGPDGLTVSYNVVNSVYQVGQANGTVDIALDPTSITMNLDGDNYPDGEIIQYGPTGSRLLLTKDMSPLQEGAVAPGVDSVDRWPFTVPTQTAPR